MSLHLSGLRTDHVKDRLDHETLAIGRECVNRFSGHSSHRRKQALGLSGDFVQHALRNPLVKGEKTSFQKEKGRKMNSLIQFKKIPTLKKLMLALLIAAVVNVPAAEAILIPLPGGGLQSGVTYIFRINADVSDVTVMLQAVVRNRLELEETATVPAGSSIDLPFTIPPRASQVILVLDPAIIGSDPQFFGDVTATILDQNLVPIIPSLTFADPHIEVVCEIVP